MLRRSIFAAVLIVLSAGLGRAQVTDITSGRPDIDLAAIIPGYSVISDVGGSTGLYAAAGTGQMHGKTGAKVHFDGLNTRSAFGNGTPDFFKN